MAKPLWDGIAQVDEIISSAALPQDEIKASANLPLSDKTAPLQEQESSTFEASEALGWGDFNLDDTAVRSDSIAMIVADLSLSLVRDAINANFTRFCAAVSGNGTCPI